MNSSGIKIADLFLFHFFVFFFYQNLPAIMGGNQGEQNSNRKQINNGVMACARMTVQSLQEDLGSDACKPPLVLLYVISTSSQRPHRRRRPSNFSHWSTGLSVPAIARGILFSGYPCISPISWTPEYLSKAPQGAVTSHDTFSHHKSLKFGQIAHKRFRVECGRSHTFNIRRTKVSFPLRHREVSCQ